MATHKRPALRSAIGQRLRQVRFEAGLGSQERLANLAGVHRTYVGRLERGETGVTVDMLVTILAPAGITLAQFFRTFTATFKTRPPRRRE